MKSGLIGLVAGLGPWLAAACVCYEGVEVALDAERGPIVQKYGDRFPESISAHVDFRKRLIVAACRQVNLRVDEARQPKIRKFKGGAG